jgi:16S rRNA (guanine527-N7)-methyltransferase
VNGEEHGQQWLKSNLGCDDRALDLLAAFVAALGEENRRQNLVAARSLDEVWWRHVVDSAQLLLVSRETKLGAGSWWDLGSGAGFPGLVIAVLSSDTQVCLVEERKARAGWLTQAVAQLGLRNVRVIGQPLKRVATEPAAVISARAFAPLGKLLGLAARFSTPETVWLLPKGESARQEVEGLPAGLRRMFRVEPSATNPAAGIVVGRGVVDARGV